MTGAKGNPSKAIAAGGLLAGALDLTQALILFGTRVPLSIAAGLLGRSAFRGGAGIYVLGVFLHFFIAFSFAAVYYAASQRLTFLKEHPLVCGLFYGGAVEEIMNLVWCRSPHFTHVVHTSCTTWFSGWLCIWSSSGCRSLSACADSRDRPVENVSLSAGMD
jgi:hypothetical protein